MATKAKVSREKGDNPAGVHREKDRARLPETSASPVRAPQQKRSEATLARILAAVNGLVTKGAYEEATVNDIVQLAKCSVGSFYARFTDKDAALFALYDARCKALEEKALPILDGGREGKEPLSKTISAFVDCVVDHTFENAGFVRAEGFLSSPRSSAPFWMRAKEMNKSIHSGLVDLLNSRQRQLTHENYQTAALIIVSMVGGLPREAVKSGAALFGVRIDLADYKAEIRQAVRGYLGIKG